MPKSRKRARRKAFRKAKRKYYKKNDPEKFEAMKAKRQSRKAEMAGKTSEERKTIRDSRKAARQERRANMTDEEKEARKKKRMEIIESAKGNFERPLKYKRNRFKGRMKQGKGLPPGIIKKFSEAAAQTPQGQGAVDKLSTVPNPSMPKNRHGMLMRRMKKMGAAKTMNASVRTGSHDYGSSSYQRPGRGPGQSGNLMAPGGKGIQKYERRVQRNPNVGGVRPELKAAIKRRRGLRY